jgi:hypothetical protein
MTRCPSTGQEIATGIACDWVTFNSLSVDRRTISCPSCGSVHTWTVDEAWLAPMATETVPEQPRKRQVG